MSLCKCGISIEPSHRMDVDESSEFWHLDKLNIVDGSSLRIQTVMTLIQTVMTLIQTMDNLEKKSPACADQAFFRAVQL